MDKAIVATPAFLVTKDIMASSMSVVFVALVAGLLAGFDVCFHHLLWWYIK
jgi:hypothetical protein